MSKRVFITGASEGLGRCFARLFAEKGYEVTAVARNEERLKTLVSELADISSLTHAYIRADLASDEGIATCERALREKRYDVLINNAGFSYFGEFDTLALDGELAVMKVNMECMLRLSHVYLEGAGQGDAIINLSSLTYYLPTPVQASYVASKNWIAAFSESLWYQGLKKGVYVQGLCPGIAKTEFIDRAGEVNHKWVIDLIATTPERVVNVSYKALLKRKGPIILPNVSDKLIVVLMRLLPRRWSVWLMGKVGGLAF